MFPIRDMNPTRHVAVVTLVLIAANVIVFFFWQPFGAGAQAELEFLYHRAAVACELVQGRPLSVGELARNTCEPQAIGGTFFPDKNVYLAVLTSMFLHANLIHLAGNMWFLWIFGDNVEDHFGRVLYLVIYVAAGIAGTLGFVLLRPDEVTPLIGASGAIAGVLGAYLVLYPMRPVLAFAGFFLLPVPAMLFIGLWVFAQFLVADPGVAWEAHVFGFAAGVILTLALRGFGRSARPVVG
ncbi:MAG: rhomboid family intramembrane serine protease [Dehalococcoidia bacterium]|nr:rhomboid family intramembrane serine protease [Dehalococcoidia bacterium]MCA9856499.1 rhomboid family intramembrane serine protease [Dehalococcoidia bacterium]MCB9484444.1 rhomboid family intramembrane serine protease [Dehalococcoidia bacterium]